MVWIERSPKLGRGTWFLLGGGVLSFKCTECDSQKEVRTISQLFNINKYGGFWIMNYPVSAGCTSWDLFGLSRRVGSVPNEITQKPGASRSREGIVTSPLIKSPYQLRLWWLGTQCWSIQKMLRGSCPSLMASSGDRIWSWLSWFLFRMAYWP